MPGRPDILDNLGDETTHSYGLAYLVGDLGGRPLSIATGYVNLGGLHALAAALEDDDRPVRLLSARCPIPASAPSYQRSHSRFSSPAFKASATSRASRRAGRPSGSRRSSTG